MRIIGFLAALLLAGSAVAQDTSIWDRAAYGSVPGVTHVTLKGTNPGVGVTFEAAWEETAAYTPLTAAMSTPYCASSSANDAAAGTGARTISVTGVNTSFERFTETVTMNGQTSVNLATASVLLIDKITVLTAGSGLVNAGIIQCGTGTNTSGDPAVTHAYLPVSSATAIPAAGAGGGNESSMFFYGVPADHTLICRNFTASTFLLSTIAGLMFAIDGYSESTGVFKRYVSQSFNNLGANATTYPGYVTFPEKTLVIGKLAATGATVGMLTAECLLIADGLVNTKQGHF